MMPGADDDNDLQGYNPGRTIQEYQEKINSLKSIPAWLQKPALPKLPWLDALPWLGHPPISEENPASSWTRLINLGVHPNVASRATTPAAPSGQASEVPGQLNLAASPAGLSSLPSLPSLPMLPRQRTPGTFERLFGQAVNNGQ
jgi:hypothetical protein